VRQFRRDVRHLQRRSGSRPVSPRRPLCSGLPSQSRRVYGRTDVATTGCREGATAAELDRRPARRDPAGTSFHEGTQARRKAASLHLTPSQRNM